MKHITRPNYWLTPLAWLYGAAIRLRNFLYDHGTLKQETYPVPIICVGNITVGGTGKTPHVEFLIRLLSPHYRVAVVSRGYKRKSGGIQEASHQSTVHEIGDEPKQIKQKFPEIRVVVDGNRRRIIRRLMAEHESTRPELILLDDGFQHRSVKPSYVIILTDYNRPMPGDMLLPVGRLREPITALFRADCIVVTKCPDNIRPIDRRIYHRDLSLLPHQRLYFSQIEYCSPVCLTPMQTNMEPAPKTAVLALTGIAKAEPFWEHIQSKYRLEEKLIFADHHNFTHKDIEEINCRFRTMLDKHPEAVVMTTEKDAVRLKEFEPYFSEELRKHLYYIPIRIRFLFESESDFCKTIRDAASQKQSNE